MQIAAGNQLRHLICTQKSDVQHVKEIERKEGMG